MVINNLNKKTTQKLMRVLVVRLTKTLNGEILWNIVSKVILLKWLTYAIRKICLFHQGFHKVNKTFSNKSTKLKVLEIVLYDSEFYYNINVVYIS